MKVEAKNTRYIKLGEKGKWEAECIAGGTLRFGYHETPHDLCTAGDWNAVQEFWTGMRRSASKAADDTRQIKHFYESGEDDLFITFTNSLLHWCYPSGVVKVLPDNSRVRATVDGWHNQSIGGSLLSSDRLAGHLLKTQMYRGTICAVERPEYLLRKLNDELSPEVLASEQAEIALLNANIDVMRQLTWQDFEMLVDLVFSTSGWRRIGSLGGAQKSVDIEMVLPSTGERAFVQVKSKATNTSLRDYLDRFADADLYDRMFFVWHTGDVGDFEGSNNVTLVNAERLSKMVIDSGLSSWLRNKVS